MPSFKTIIISIVLMLLLGMRFMLYYQNQKSFKDGQKLEFKTRLTEEPQVIYGHQQFRVKPGNGERITIITGLNPVYQYGDSIRVSGTVSQKYYKGRKLISIKDPSLQVDNTDHNFITGAATYIRRKSKTIYENNLSPSSSSLLIGIVFGGNQGMPQKFLTQLRNSGVIHVIAASGMNVTFVATALVSILGIIFKRQIALTIAIFGILFYAFLAGFEPSIMRATIMSILAITGTLLGRQNYAVIFVFITGFVMLFISPFLIIDVGFQLSILATLGILIIKPLFPQGKNILIDDLTTTISAQITTLPVLLSVFGSYGILSILVNALVLWTVPILMILGVLALVFGIIFESLGKIFLFLSEPILFFFEKVVGYFGNLGWTLTVPSISGAVWIGYYFLLFAAIFLIKQKRAKNEHVSEKPREIFHKTGRL